MFPFRIGDRTAFYLRILRIRASPEEPGTSGRPDAIPILSDARRKRILEEARAAVLDRIRRPG